MALPTNHPDFVNISCTRQDVATMLELLGFTHEMAKFVIEVESTRPNPIDLTELRRYLSDVQHIISVIYASAEEQDQPPRGDLH